MRLWKQKPLGKRRRRNEQQSIPKRAFESGFRIDTSFRQISYRPRKVDIFNVLRGDDCTDSMENDLVSVLYQQVQMILDEPNRPFILYVSPPLKNLDQSLTFWKSSLSPASLVYFKWADGETSESFDFNLGYFTWFKKIGATIKNRLNVSEWRLQSGSWGLSGSRCNKSIVKCRTSTRHARWDGGRGRGLSYF